MKISDIIPLLFLKNPLFYQLLLFYGKKAEPSLFAKVLKTQTPLIMVGGQLCIS